MKANLRHFQNDFKSKIHTDWNQSARNVLGVLPTGTGKTVVFSNILFEHNGPCCAIAHRQELVSQISLALARESVYHRIIGPKNVVKLCVNLHMRELGASFYNPSTPCAVAGVDTLIRRGPELSAWANSVTMWVMDEAHHVLRKNKWGKAVAMFPNAKGLGVTATPTRTDGNGLGRHVDGVFDSLVVGLGMRDAINQGYLTDYRIFSPPSNIDLSDVPTTQAGDYSQKKMIVAVKRSQIIGDIVAHYLRVGPGKLGVSFLPDVETATLVAGQFNASGVPAAVVSAKTPNQERINILSRFKRRELLQLVNVDLFGEGFDLPAIEIVSFGRPTESFGLFTQQFGRVLRLMLNNGDGQYWDNFSVPDRLQRIATSPKPVGVILDHTGNCIKHGLPDKPQKWTLERREKRSKGNGEPMLKACPNCTAAYERFLIACPYCGHKPVPAVRSGPEFVDGDLTELDPDTLAKMRGEVAQVDMHPETYRAQLAAKYTPIVGQMAGVKRHVARQEAQTVLRESIAWWAGHQRAANRPDGESYRRFYLKFGVDVLTAQTLGVKDATNLTERINGEMG